MLQKATKFLQPKIIDFDFAPIDAYIFSFIILTHFIGLVILSLFLTGIISNSIFKTLTNTPYNYIFLLQFLFIIKNLNVYLFLQTLQLRQQLFNDKYSYIKIELLKMVYVLLSTSVLLIIFSSIASEA